MNILKVRHSWVAIAAVCLIALVISVFSLRESRSGVDGILADQIIVKKEAHTMTLLRKGEVVKTYRVALGRGGAGQKLQAGDNKVPEGVYRIVSRNPHSAFHRALKVGYPTAEQVKQAHLRGLDPGGDIMLHGIRNGLGWIGSFHRKVDWTKGCIAVTNDEIEEIWRLVPDGTPIEIDR